MQSPGWERGVSDCVSCLVSVEGRLQLGAMRQCAQGERTNPDVEGESLRAQETHRRTGELFVMSSDSPTFATRLLHWGWMLTSLRILSSTPYNRIR